MAKTRRMMTLTLDELDYRAIQGAILPRLNLPVRSEDGGPIMPDGDSDTWGAAVAEICRGWCEFMGLEIKR